MNRMTDNLQAFQAIVDAVSEATEKERQRCLDIAITEAEKHRGSPHASHALAEVAHKIREGSNA